MRAPLLLLIASACSSARPSQEGSPDATQGSDGGQSQPDASGGTDAAATVAGTCDEGFALGSAGCLPIGSLSLAASATDAAQGVFLKYVYSFSLPAGATSAVGLGGSVSIAGNGAGLSEALFSVGYLPSGQCLPDGSQFTDYGALFAAMPGAVSLGTFIVKAFGTETAPVTTNIDLPVALPISGCAFVILDGGTPMQSTSGTVTMTSAMSLRYTSQSGATAYQLGPGDEFCTGQSVGCELATASLSGTFASSWRIPQAGTIVALYGDVSEGALSAPSGPWNAQHEFYLDPACSAFGSASFGLFGPGNYFASIPADATALLTTTIGAGGDDLQSAIFQPVQAAANAGDCIVHLITTNGTGAVDAEMQVHALIQPGSQALEAGPGYPTAPMYRFYKASTGEHFFTASQSEGTAAGFTSEGIAFNFLSGTGMAGTSTIYRCNDTKHFISLDPNCEGSTVEGAYGALYTDQVIGTTPVFRFDLTSNGDFLETLDSTEGLQNGYFMDRVLGYAP